MITKYEWGKMYCANKLSMFYELMYETTKNVWVEILFLFVKRFLNIDKVKRFIESIGNLVFLYSKFFISCPFLWCRQPFGGSWWRSQGLARRIAWFRVFSPCRWSMAACPRWPSSFWRPQRVVVRRRVSSGFWRSGPSGCSWWRRS